MNKGTTAVDVSGARCYDRTWKQPRAFIWTARLCGKRVVRVLEQVGYYNEQAKIVWKCPGRGRYIDLDARFVLLAQIKVFFWSVSPI